MIFKRGLETSTSSAEILQKLEAFSDRILRIAFGAEEILTVAETSPDEPTVHLACGLFWLFGQTRGAQDQASAVLQQIPPGSLSLREMQWLNALRLWHQKDFACTAETLEALTHEWPADLLATKAAEFLAMDVFAHELCGDGIRARRIAERALEITPRNPWAHHALEHVLLWEGNPEAAIVVMERWIADWEASARPIHSHNYWHLALAQLDCLEVEKAFAVFDAQDDIFRFAHIDSLRKSGRDSEATALLKARMAAKTPSPLKESLV